MTKIYADSEEKYLKAVVVYQAMGDKDSLFLTWDLEGTKRVYADEATELFRKGLLLIHTGDSVDFTERSPVSLETMENGVRIQINFDGEAINYVVPFSKENEDTGEGKENADAGDEEAAES